jgi:hypothetical protein
MNAFHEHHMDNIRLSYRCFDRLLLNGLIQPFQQSERVIGFFNSYREGRHDKAFARNRDLFSPKVAAGAALLLC